MRNSDTIVARASAAGIAPRAVIRISGAACSGLLGSLTGSGLGPRGVTRRRISLAQAGIPGAIPCLVFAMPQPASYTGEDTAEVQVAGSEELVRRLLAAATSIHGVRLAEPGEFTARAYLAGRLTVEQAEGVAAIIAARNADQARAARVLLAGGAGDRYRDWVDALANLLALVEAGIDFTDQEDVVAISPDALSSAIGGVLSRAAEWAGADHRSTPRGPGSLPVVALIGPPNAGKSTLFNALLARLRAVTSPRAGTTRDVLVEPLDLTGVSPGASEVSLMDLPGLDSSGLSAPERAAQDAARRAVLDADVLVHCDPSGRFDIAIDHSGPVVRVRTQIDRAWDSDHVGSALGVCALDGRGMDTLRRAVADAVWGAGESPLAAAPRHLRAVSAAIDHLHAALALIVPGSRALAWPETIAAELRSAIDSLGELVGNVTPDEVLGRLFRSFCVGK